MVMFMIMVDTITESGNSNKLMGGQVELTLASSSPRRRELLALTGWAFETCSSPVPESPLPGESPEDLAVRLARSKGEAARESCPDAEVLLAADTMVVLDGAILGKPADAAEAETMLKDLRDGGHEVLTAVSIFAEDRPPLITLCQSSVPMRAYRDEEIKAYVAGGSPLDKAGAYGIQDPDFNPVDQEAFTDCFANVMGLPLCHLARAMRGLGYEAPEDVPQACMQFTGYECTIYPTIMRGDR